MHLCLPIYKLTYANMLLYMCIYVYKCVLACICILSYIIAHYSEESCPQFR